MRVGCHDPQLQRNGVSIRKQHVFSDGASISAPSPWQNVQMRQLGQGRAHDWATSAIEPTSVANPFNLSLESRLTPVKILQREERLDFFCSGDRLFLIR